MSAPAIGVRSRWVGRPESPIDWSHPMSQGLAFAVAGGAVPMVDKVAGRVLTSRGSPTSNARTIYGAGVDMASSSNKGGFLNIGTTGDPLRLEMPLTIAWVGHQVASPGGGGVYHGSSYDTAGGSPYYGAILTVNGGSFVSQFSYSPVGVGNNTINGTTVMTSYRGPLVLVGTLNSSTGAALWVNGVREGTNGVTGTSGVSYSATSEHQIGTYLAGNNRGCGGNMAGAFAWSRELSVAEIEAFTADPFQMFRQ